MSEVAAQSHVARDLVIGDRTEAEAQASLCYAINPMYSGNEHSH